MYARASGNRHELGRLVSILGDGPATSRCPEEMQLELGDLTAAIIEGQARQQVP